MDIMKSILGFVNNNPWFTLFGTLTIVQITPIKINPWSKILSLLKKCLIGDLDKRVNSLEKLVIDEKVENKRWNILQFANTCHRHVKHTREEWAHCLKELDWYDKFCKENDVPNGEMVACSAYLRSLYQDLLKSDSFLQEALKE